SSPMFMSGSVPTTVGRSSFGSSCVPDISFSVQPMGNASLAQRARFYSPVDRTRLDGQAQIVRLLSVVDDATHLHPGETDSVADGALFHPGLVRGTDGLIPVAVRLLDPARRHGKPAIPVSHGS